MRVTDFADLGDKKVEVCELTVAEIRQWLARDTQGLDVVDSMLFEDINLKDLLILTRLNQDEVDALTPSEIVLVKEKAKEVNIAFFEMRERVVAMGLKTLAAGLSNLSEMSQS